MQLLLIVREPMPTSDDSSCDVTSLTRQHIKHFAVNIWNEMDNYPQRGDRRHPGVYHQRAPQQQRLKGHAAPSEW